MAHLAARPEFHVLRPGHREHSRFCRELAESQRALAVEDGVIARHAGGGRDIPAPGRRGDEHGARSGAGPAQALVPFADAGRTVGFLVAVPLVGVALHNLDACHVRPQFVGEQRRDRAAHALAHLRAGADQRHQAVGGDVHEDVRVEAGRGRLPFAIPGIDGEDAPRDDSDGEPT